MSDVIYVLITAGFFAACVALVRGCDRLLGPDELIDLVDQSDTADRTAAPTVGATR